MALYKNEKKVGKNYYLFPNIQPYSNSYIKTDDGNKVYFEECGNPDGLPVLVIHGGPGAGCNPNMRRYFDPKFYRIILFDQRGCGRSLPHNSITNNTTWHLIDDIEKIRKKIKIKKFIIFGGSWGSTLGLIYSINFPQNVIGMILRGIFLMTRKELDWFYKDGGASLFWPEKWKEHTKHFLPYTLFGQIRSHLDEKVNNILSQECGLYSDKYRVAGRVDCIAEYNGTPSIIDFKTSTKERNDEWNESYYIQASAYAEMFEERTGKPIEQVVILVVTEDGVVQEFIKKKHEYIPMLEEVIQEFNVR